MEKYMTVVLKDKYRNEQFITALNELLAIQFGANTGCKFNSRAHIAAVADYYNETGKTELPGVVRPVTSEFLEKNCFWYRFGEFSFRLSGCDSSDEARNAVAVCKWLLKTCYRYISRRKSSNYSVKDVHEYLDHLFEQDGYDMKALWMLPDTELPSGS